MQGANKAWALCNAARACYALAGMDVSGNNDVFDVLVAGHLIL